MGMEPDTPDKSVVEHDYRITRSGNGIKIEVLDYHPGPLFLTNDALNKDRGHRRKVGRLTMTGTSPVPV